MGLVEQDEAGGRMITKEPGADSAVDPPSNGRFLAGCPH